MSAKGVRMEIYVNTYGECEPFDQERFVRTYANAYFLGAPRIVPGIRQSCRYVEGEVEEILRNGFFSSSDAIRVMAWKAGKIKQRCSQDSLSFKYNSDWANWETEAAGIDGGDVKALERQSRVGVPYFAAWVWASRKEERWSPALRRGDIQEVLDDMSEHCPPGVGTTQMLSLLYFISRGAYPIIDRFAGTALAAISSGVSPDDKTLVRSLWKELPAKGSKGFRSVVRNCVLPYRKTLNCLFGGAWETDRNIDRALWVYGHRFAGSVCR